MSSLIILNLNYIIIKIHFCVDLPLTFFFWLVLLFKMLCNFTIHAYLLMFFLKNQSIISFLSLGCLIKEICLLNSSSVYSTSQLIYYEVKKRYLGILTQNCNTVSKKSWQSISDIEKYLTKTHKVFSLSFSWVFFPCTPSLIRWTNPAI